MIKHLLKFMSLICLIGICACISTPAAGAGKIEKEAKNFKEKFKKEVVDKLNNYAHSNRETGKEYMLFTPEDLKETLEAEIKFLFDQYLEYKPALPYDQLKSLMNMRKKYFRDGIYKAENLTFEQANPPERVIFIEVLPGGKKLRCRLIPYEKNGRVTSLDTYTIETGYILTDPDRINFTVTRKGCDRDQHMAYERARLYIKTNFVAEVFPSWIDLVREEVDNRFIEHIREQSIGMTPPGIDYTQENEAHFFKEDGRYCVWVKGWMKKDEFDQWARAFKGVSQ